MTPRRGELRHRVILELEGSEAVRGLSLAGFATFTESLRAALREFHRQRRLEQTRRGGHPSALDELVTAFRIVEVKPGSAIVTLEPPAESPEAPDQQAIAEVETLAFENFRALLDTIEFGEAPLDPAVTESLARARKALGEDGRIGIVMAGRPRRRRRRVIVDEEKVRSLEQRAKRHGPRPQRISGRLHMIDVEPDRVAIRAADGTDWVCHYPDDLEGMVKGLVGSHVWARGTGQRQSAVRGTLTIDEIHPVDEYEQTPLFTYERVPLADLMVEQGITGPQAAVELVPDEVTEEELDRFVEALLES